MKKIVVGSGKGGVGKSMLASSLATLFSKNNRIVAVDCDVDAPNLDIWLGGGDWQKKEPISVTKIAQVNPKKCTGCGKCQEVCHFSAIKVKNGKAKVNRFLCEGCGSCKLVCPHGAISLKPVVNGYLKEKETSQGFKLHSGSLTPGQSGSGKMVTELKKKAEKEKVDLMIIDSSPGTGCPVVASFQGADLAVLITEPTPAGREDLYRAIKVANSLQVDYRVVINKYDINPEISKKLTEKFENKLIGKISYNKKIFKSLTRMQSIIGSGLKTEKEIEKIFNKINE
jgi:MinD superfamily P-loop ATPase